MIQIPTRPSQSLTNGGTQASVIFLKWFLNGQPGLGATGVPFVPVSLQSQPQPAMTEVCVCVTLKIPRKRSSSIICKLFLAAL